MVAAVDAAVVAVVEAAKALDKEPAKKTMGNIVSGRC